ncbi:MAG: hypothetical protein KY449_10825 [Proteobacteria bacterium]|nr:hypothetical protein [Pseudomonadota bacterium]
MAEGSQELRRENAYLKQGCAQPQGDVTDLAVGNMGLRQELERIAGRRAMAKPDPLAGGQ